MSIDSLVKSVPDEETESEARDRLEQESEWQTMKADLQDEAISRGEWAGIPVPIKKHELVLEERYPFQQLNNLSLIHI